MWRYTWRKNGVNYAVLTGNSAGLRTVISSCLSHRELRSSLRESHSFLGISAATTMTSCQGTQPSKINKRDYNGLIINNGSQKHNYICKYNNLPTTCFGLIRPSSGWNTVSGENYLSDLNAGVQGRGRGLVYKYGVSGWNSVGTSVCPLGEFLVGRLARGVGSWGMVARCPDVQMATVRVLLWRVYSLVGGSGGRLALLLENVKKCDMSW